MKRIILEYFSNNGIRLHHFVYEASPEQPEVEEIRLHNYHKLILQLSGNSKHFIDGITYNVSPMDLSVIPQNVLHSIEFSDVSPCETITFMFMPSLLPAFQDKEILSALNDAAEYNYTIPAKYVKKSNIKKTFDAIIESCKRKDRYSELQIAIHILELTKALTHIVEEYSLEINALRLSAKTHTLSSLGVQYIKEHLTESLSVEDIANELHVSASHFRQTFKKETGVTIHQYIFEQKMYLAFQLLSHGESPTSVAEKLGYDYYSTFYHHYTKRFKQSPKKVFSHVDKQRLYGENIEETPQNKTE